jgi:predicted dehydrogenase
VAGLTAASAMRVPGANDRIRIGLMGAGGRGVHVAGKAKEFANAEIAAMADIYEPRVANVRQGLNPGVTVYRDFRALLENKDLDAVIIGAPDHWHVPMTIAAVQAGKDVYVEKPLTHSVEEGRAVIEAVKRSGRVVQVGYQQRSYPHMAEARRLIQAGRIGKVTQVLTWWNQNYSGRPKPQVDVSKLEWAQFLGNACPREFDVWRYTNWRWFWDYGGGTLTDLFSHWVDTVHWVMDDSVPLEVRGQGSKFDVDWYETPDTVNASWLYPKKFQVTYASTMVTKMEDGGIIFRGTGGSLKLTRPFFELYDEKSAAFDRKTYLPPAVEKGEAQRDGTIDHVLNWLECVKSRKEPNAPVGASVDAANAAHWGNEAIRSGRSVSVPAAEGAWKPLFNGRDLEGWMQDTPGVWSVRDGMILGRHAGQKWNDFLRTKDWFEDFELSLEFRLVNGTGNSGVQFRSVPADKEHELSGYQADIGDKYWGCLYDESRRNRVLAQAPSAAVDRLDGNGWHTYLVRAHGDHVTLTLDGMRTVDYQEAEPGIRKRGLIALQVHSGPGIEVWFRNLRLRELG